MMNCVYIIHIVHTFREQLHITWSAGGNTKVDKIYSEAEKHSDCIYFKWKLNYTVVSRSN